MFSILKLLYPMPLPGLNNKYNSMRGLFKLLICYLSRASNKVFAGQDFLNPNTSLKCLILRTYVLYY
nr:MAG TPA: hypothetical protein [Caudoviricetes sp.]